MKTYRINVSIDGLHYFKIEKVDCTEEHAIHLAQHLERVMPDAGVSMTAWETIGKPVVYEHHN